MIARRLRRDAQRDIDGQKRDPCQRPTQPPVHDRPAPDDHATHGDRDTADDGEVRRADAHQPSVAVAVGIRYDDNPQENDRRQGHDPGIHRPFPARVLAVVQVDQHQAGETEHGCHDVSRLHHDQRLDLAVLSQNHEPRHGS